MKNGLETEIKLMNLQGIDSYDCNRRMAEFVCAKQVGVCLNWKSLKLNKIFRGNL